MKIKLSKEQLAVYSLIDFLARIAGKMKSMGANDDQVSELLGTTRRTYYEWRENGFDKPVLHYSKTFADDMLCELYDKEQAGQALTDEELKFRHELELRLDRFLDQIQEVNLTIEAEVESWKKKAEGKEAV